MGSEMASARPAVRDEALRLSPLVAAFRNCALAQARIALETSG